MEWAGFASFTGTCCEAQVHLGALCEPVLVSAELMTGGVP